MAIGLGALSAIVVVLVLLFAGDGVWLKNGQSLANVLPGRGQPDELPVMLNQGAPFRYPASLYVQKIQGNVTLRIFIDRDGRVRPESTRVEASSGYESLDSAAVTGSHDLRFRPAKQHGEPMAVSILFPVFFRHPDASPLPGDTILTKPPRN